MASTDHGRHDAKFPNRATERLYEAALQKQWRIDREIDWGVLTLASAPLPTRRAMCAVYSCVHYVEAYGLGLCGRLVDVAKEGLLRQFAATQVMDEARHVEFFGRLIGMLGEERSIPEDLVSLHRTVADVRSELELVLHGQIVETAAQVLFAQTARRSRELMQRSIALPGRGGIEELARCLVKFIGRDEARHIAFGERFLAARLHDIGTQERNALERRLSQWSCMFHTSFGSLRGELARLGLSASELLNRVWGQQCRHFRRLGFELEERPLLPSMPDVPAS